jgi:hypothetical protein
MGVGIEGVGIEEVGIGEGLVSPYNKNKVTVHRKQVITKLKDSNESSETLFKARA